MALNNWHPQNQAGSSRDCSITVYAQAFKDASIIQQIQYQTVFLPAAGVVGLLRFYYIPHLKYGGWEKNRETLTIFLYRKDEQQTHAHIAPRFDIFSISSTHFISELQFFTIILSLPCQSWLLVPPVGWERNFALMLPSFDTRWQYWASISPLHPLSKLKCWAERGRETVGHR